MESELESEMILELKSNLWETLKSESLATVIGNMKVCNMESDGCENRTPFSFIRWGILFHLFVPKLILKKLIKTPWHN